MALHRSCAVLAMFAAAFGAALLLAAPTVDAQPRARAAYVPAPVRHPIRPRLGAHFDVGPIERSDAGLGIGATGAVGTQYGDFFGIYYQPRIFVGGFTSGASDTAFFAWYNTAMFELTFLSAIQLGAGPSLDVARLEECNANFCDDIGGVFLGADFRAAVVIGGRDRGPRAQRGGVDISLHAHPTWLWENRGMTSFTVGVGFELY